ncbi:molybdenum cofactor sulfurtransferase [Marchantia polymorpha subsp. ruderalis]|uniref:Molybdenum cofactor sulfurase n=1 Tax=Marchantia polymorpha TaxID=3197 RepID=A0A2R6WVA5_MARPO|nr:hypothetical protein MARPO_0055s0057 [Marchantia polymorpha]BBN03005.1 hypothetical protein Mp_2g19930 [Marchantia polymorpha subsp. ruderalis]|eukprot:PTQ37783.1 hypothetical protein MARPO_0055s0057 [Marchantia polymorpha]
MHQMAYMPVIAPSRKRHERSTQKLSSQKSSFLKEYGDDYGYQDGPISVDELRSKEFARLQGSVYLDHAGTTLYAENQLKSVLLEFSTRLYGNPRIQYIQSESSTLSSSIVKAARAQVLASCNASAEEYSCVFTSGATAALKLVGETFPWTNESQYMYTTENHNSVLGIREYALDLGATVTPVDIFPSSSKLSGESGSEEFDVRKRSSQVRGPSGTSSDHISSRGHAVYNLFAFPHECNFSGAKFDLGLVSYVQEGRHTHFQRGQWLVLLDAAKGCSTSPPDLRKFPADFVAISFYKIFGYPTGLGALLVRKGASELMKKKYFGGGTVAVSIADEDFVQRRLNVEERLEDGTISFLSIAALRHGFTVLSQLNMAAIRRHTGSLTGYTASKLDAFRHYNGLQVCTLYGNHASKMKKNYCDPHSDQGPIIAFNMKRADGSWIGSREVEKLASLRRIHLRTGCFCNPGACAKYLGLSSNDMKENFEAGHVCWDDNDVINGRPTGAVRVSFGYMSTFEDCSSFLDLISTYFVERYNSKTAPLKEKDVNCLFSVVSNSFVETKPSGGSTVSLQSIIVYPIKSCAGFTAKSWPLGDCGLLYDRDWLIKSTSGEVLTQKKCPSMWSIKTHIDLETGILHVEAPNMKGGIDIPLNNVANCEPSSNVTLCSNPVGANQCGLDADRWFSEALETPCSLVKRDVKSRFIKPRRSTIGSGDKKVFEEEETELSFANEGQILLVSQSSVDNLNSRLVASTSQRDYERNREVRSDKQHFQVDVKRFRPNLVVVGSEAYDEDLWDTLAIGDEQFKVRGGCNRCTMVNIDQSSGKREALSEPLATLASYRRFKGQINFGILIEQARHCTDRRLSSKEDETSKDSNVDSDILKRSHNRLVHVGQRVRVVQTLTN